MKDEIAARLASIREREQAATPGPWEAHDYNGGSQHITPGYHPNEWLAQFWDAKYEEDFLNSAANAAFVAAARTDVGYLLGVAEAAAAFLSAYFDDADRPTSVADNLAAIDLMRAFVGEVTHG